jgi:uncharacterized protein YdcH (DUF465 family)
MKSISEQAEEGTDKALTKFQQWCKDTFGDGKDVAKLTAKIAELDEKIAAHAGIVTAKDEEITNLKASLTAKDTEISTLKTEHATALEKATKTAAATTLAKTGVSAIPETAADATKGAETLETLQAKMQSEPDSKKRHALAKQYIALRDAK